MDARPDPVETATGIVRERFPDAVAVFLGGTVLGPKATPASDLDIVVVMPEDDPDAPFRESLRFGGWPIELFVHTETSVVAFRTRPGEERKAGLAWIVAGSVPLTGGDRAEWIQAAERAYVQAGPRRMDDAALDRLRYGVTDLLDDLLADPTGPEAAFMLTSLLPALVDLELERRGAWRGTGKWILRRADEVDPHWASSLADAIDAWKAGDAEPLAAIVRATLDASGGPLFEGYRASGRPRLGDTG